MQVEIWWPRCAADKEKERSGHFDMFSERAVFLARKVVS